MTRRRTPREIELTVTELTEEGLGRGRFEDREVHVRNALPGDRVVVRVLQRRRGVWRGEAATPEQQTPPRTVPACEYFPRCGGCSLQHLDYRAQLEHKQQVLQQLLVRAAVTPRRWRSPATGPRLHYRYKARLGVRAVGDELLVGFREGFSNRVVRMDHCAVLAEPLVAALPELKRTLARLSRPDRIPQVELAGGDRHFAMVLRHLTDLDDRDRRLLETLSGQTGLRVFLQPGNYDTVTPLVEGDDRTLSYTNPDFGLCYRFEPTDFTQVNPHVNRLLVRSALLALDPRPGAHAVDLFCGIGNFSLALARSGVRVLGLEAAAGAVDRAARNARFNGLSGLAEFAVADLYDARCPDLPATDYLLLDPPRSGAGPNLARWVRAPRLQRIVYVSCSPVSFAADAAELAALGFELEEVGVYDMFPHTAHIETLGLFVRRVDHHG